LQSGEIEAVLKFFLNASAEDCYELRESVLRPGQPKENWTYDLDYDPKTKHVAVELDDEIIAVASLLPENHDYCPRHPWRLRGMAVKKEMQGKNIGQKLLNEIILKVIPDGEGIWCTARKNVQDFYLKNGFEIFGKEFTMNAMPHVYMRRIDIE
jgi:predicted GNAT family N-acyltransferase